MDITIKLAVHEVERPSPSPKLRDFLDHGMLADVVAEHLDEQDIDILQDTLAVVAYGVEVDR